MDSLDVRGRRVLLRVDFNTTFGPDSTPDNPLRLDDSLDTLVALLKHGARVGILTHRGRPQGRPTPGLSTAALLPWLTAALAARGLANAVSFAPDCIGRTAQHAMDALEPGRAVLLENTRFHLGEQLNQLPFVQQLAALGELFINDAFACAHRPQASTSGLASLLPTALGLHMMTELRRIYAWHSQTRRPRVLILGGSHVLVKLDLLARLLGHVDIVMLGGAVGNTFLAAKDIDLFQTLIDFGALEPARNLLTEAGVLGCRLHLPRDLATAHTDTPTQLHSFCAPHQLTPQLVGCDIGPATTSLWQRLLADAAHIVWLGALGQAEHPAFARSTLALADTLTSPALRDTPKLIAGNGLVNSLARSGHMETLRPHASSAGLALHVALGGQPLPALQFLRTARR